MSGSGAKVRSRQILLRGRDGGEVPTLIVEPEAPGPHPAVVFGAEAMGPNRFGRKVADDIAALGYVAVTPDYYRGRGPSRPDDYTDFTEVMAAIEALDFGRATFDLLAAIDWARAQRQVDAAKVAVWGYCTGATLTMLAASLDRSLAATVLFFPSQPRFPELTTKRPLHPVELVWAMTAPVLFISGDLDAILGPDVVADIRRRLELAGVDHEIQVYPGAGHAFSAEAAPHMYNAEASARSWAVATDFLARNMAARS